MFSVSNSVQDFHNKCYRRVLAPPCGSLQNKIRCFNQTNPFCHAEYFHETAFLSIMLG